MHAGIFPLYLFCYVFIQVKIIENMLLEMIKELSMCKLENNDV